MTKEKLSKTWFKRAKSNLEIARSGQFSQEIYYEDLVFEIQQAAEKALKAFLIQLEQPFPKTHSIDALLQLIAKKGIAIPQEIRPSVLLTRYAVQTRYPGVYEDLTKEDYQKALQLAEKVLNWVGKLIEG